MAFTFPWYFENSTKILTGLPEAVFRSRNFEYKGITFNIECTPNGYSPTTLPTGTVCFWLQVIRLPNGIKSADIELTFTIDKLNWTDTKRRNNFGYGPGLSFSVAPDRNILLTSEFKSLSNEPFTVKCDIIVHNMVQKTAEDELSGSLMYSNQQESIETENKAKLLRIYIYLYLYSL